MISQIEAALLLLFWVKAQRRGVDAIALAGGSGAIRKNVAQVRVALGAKRLGALHEKAVVALGGDVFFRRGRRETRPSGAGIELLIGAEQFGAAADAAIHPGLVVIPIAARKRALGALFAGYGELLRRQFRLPFGIAFHDFVHVDSLPLSSIVGEDNDIDSGAGAAHPGVGNGDRKST